MKTELITQTAEQAPALSTGRVLGRLCAVGVIILAVVAAFLWLGGWLNPRTLTPARFVDTFELGGGNHSGFRRNHAKGVDVSGFFDSNGQGTRLSRAFVFRPGRIPVLGRFSFGGSDPEVADAPDTVRGLGLMFQLQDGEQWRTAMVNFPVFPARTPEVFHEFIVASQPDPRTHRPDTTKMRAFLARHPEVARALGLIGRRQISSGFANTTFNSLNAFRFENAAGTQIPVRWSLVAVQPFAPGDTPAAAQGNRNYLFDALIADIHRQPLQWRLMVTIGQPGDVTDDASVPWPAAREQVEVGTLTLNSVESDDTSPARDINFDPLILPDGIAPSDDPLLSARSAVYSQSYTRREGETKEPAAISPSEVRK